MTIFSISTVYKDYQAGGGKNDAKQSHQGQHHAFDEREGDDVPCPAKWSTATREVDGGGQAGIGKTINVST